ncbi:MAG: hypothetical protein EBR02_03010 [Alphaproteobacteria bacterium]|nr:hypothetical protein [Alphaproteobacteria bacterium]
MTGVIAKLLLDTLIIVLLALTISYCWLLNRRIKILQDSKSELASLLKYFDESTQRASETIVALQAASKKIGENMQARIEKANYALDDLNFMIEKGSKLADQMEANFAVSRARGRVNPPQAAAPQIADEAPPHPVMAPPEIRLATRQEPVLPAPTSRERTAATLSAVLEKISGRNSTNVSNGSKSPMGTPVTSASRSQAEQELLELLRAGMKG